MWDDHEIANNPWTNGGENHQPEREGAYATRERAAIRAYHEWLPTREPTNVGNWSDKQNGPFAYNRTVHFGDVISFVVMETRLVARTDPNANPAGNVFANLTTTFSQNTHPAPARWAGSALEAALRRLASDLDAYRSRDDAYVLGAEQTRWVAAEARASRDAGVAWQAFAQASPVMNGKSPDVEKAADALDAANTHAPPGLYTSWRAALRAWTAWDDDDAVPSGPERGAFGVGGRGVGGRRARALLALGRYGINWDFDDWRGYVAERERFLNAVTSASNRALVLGGDSHDAWAGVIPNDRETWGLGYAGSGAGTDDENSFDAAAVAEFDAPGVTPPGAFEQAFPWAPSVLIDAGHLIANANTMKYARTGNRGFLLLSVTPSVARGDFFFVPSVRERRYFPECGASFEAREAGGGETVSAPVSRDDDSNGVVSSFPGRETAEDDRDGVSRASRVAVRRVGRAGLRGRLAPRDREKRPSRSRKLGRWLRGVLRRGGRHGALLCARGWRRGVLPPEEAPIAKRRVAVRVRGRRVGPPDRDGVPEPLAAEPSERRARAGGGAQRVTTLKIVCHTKGVCYA